MTEYEYNADGLVTSVTRKDGAETLASVSVAYDESARPVSVRDQDGRVTAFDRDEFGRVLKETFADGSEVAYTYDAFGRRTSVLDENGHKISFDWNRFGLSSRTTAENQLTDYVRDDDGLVTEILSKQNGCTDRSIRNEYDEYGRLVYVDYGKGGNEDFTWDGLALIQRGDEHFLNEPHVGGGNPIASSKGASYFNDMLGTTVGAKKGAKYSAATISAFGEHLAVNAVDDSSHSPFPVPHSQFFTGKPQVPGLGYAFLMRNYRAGLGKWQTADPLGYPDGWNALAYCGNGVTGIVDLWGCHEKHALGVESAIWTFGNVQWGMDYYGVCNGNGKITCTSMIASGSATGSITEEIASGVKSALNGVNIHGKTATYNNFSAVEVPGSREEGKGYLKFDVMITCNVIVSIWQDLKVWVEDKEAPDGGKFVTKRIISEASYTVQLTTQEIEFKCHREKPE